MEQKKILWIILSVALFLVVVLGIGLIWFRPVSADTASGDGSAESPRTAGTNFDAIEYIREGDGFPGLEPAVRNEEQDFVAVSGDLVLGENPSAAVPDKTAVKTELPEVVTAAVPVKAPAEKQTSAPTAAPAPVKTSVTVKEYWIQAGAFESTSRAGEVKQLLTEKGFSPIISTRDVGGTTYFRVRLGPYANQNEAGKFLAWVKELDGFSSAWISEVTVTR